MAHPLYLKAATLSTFDGDSVRSVVLELSNPRLKKNALAYDVRILGGDVPARGGSSSLFIDGLIGAGIHGAALGAVGGAIGGDTRKGAEIGAGVGAAAHLMGPRRAAYRY